MIFHAKVADYVCGESVRLSAMARTRGDAVRRRPKDRKAQIAQASAEAFSALGYHGVSMDAIAARVGISAAALYRHYSSKYELFRDAVLNLGQQLVDCTAFADEAPPTTRRPLCGDSSQPSSTPHWPTGNPAGSTAGRPAICGATIRPPSTVSSAPSTAGSSGRCG